MIFNVYHRTGRLSEIISTHNTHDAAARERDHLNAEEREANGGRLNRGHWYECDDPILSKFLAYHPIAIWGIGETEEEALADALGWISRNADHDEQSDISENLSIIRCTDELAARVASTGGNTSFDVSYDQYGEYAN